jgi:hypothetical protein
MSHSRIIRFLVAILFVMAAWLHVSAQSTHFDSPDRVFWIKSPMPLGTNRITLQPSGQHLLLLGCLEDHRFDRLQVSRVRESPFVIDASGDVWKNYPDELTFRITATALDSSVLQADNDTISETADMNSFLLGLHFRLKSFHGLRMKVVQPSSVRLIGVPADVPYQERVYRVAFDTGDFPVDDRLVMEVLSPRGQLLTRFHLELE